MIGPSKEIRDELKRLQQAVRGAEIERARNYNGGNRYEFEESTHAANIALRRYMREHGLTINGWWSAEGKRRLLKEKMREAYSAGFCRDNLRLTTDEAFEDWYKEHGTL